ncbi:MAG TPA: hypothetical protein PLM56_06095 [Cyclobacteriaceae bacterium]|jgi:hypothetical protein|nr:hypothetical protein [Cyclobacteriaceae bacterium]HRE67344.1 hypothetical protein [Cyclobacteriaceae bacterium]HRF33048.1 hypothetical protein [Cyclobacteriaceae bacterium]
MKKIEMVLFIAAALGAVLMLNVDDDSTLVILSFSSLSLFYFFLSFVLFNDIRLRDIFKKSAYHNTNAKKIIGAIVLGFTISIIIIGALFRFLLVEGGNLLHLFGLMVLIVILIINVILYLRSMEKYYVNTLIRTIIYGVLGVILFYTPHSAFLRIYYRGYPEYIELYKKLEANPENKELRYELEHMEEEMFRP